MFQVYDTQVAKRFTIYNSLFLDLPFSDIHRTGTLLPILSSKCQEGFEKDKTPKEIIRGFFNEMMANSLTTPSYIALSENLNETNNVLILNAISSRGRT